MFDIEEFYKARKRLFENQSNINSLSELQKYIFDLKLVCANERSTEIADLLSTLIEVAKPFKDNQVLFELYWQYFLQTYYYVEKIDKTQEMFGFIKAIAGSSKEVKHESLVYQADSLMNQLKGDSDRAIKLMQKALNTIEPHKNLHPEVYYGALYSLTYLSFNMNCVFSDALENMEECFSYYSESYRVRGLISVIHNLFKFYLNIGDEGKIEKLLNWILNNDYFQDNILSNLYVSLNWSLGMMFTIRNKLDEAIRYLHNAYTKINKEGLHKELMYEHTGILKFLSRCYAYQGRFNQSYNLLVELIGFMEDAYVKINYYQKGKRFISISSYYTLMFIFVQLDLDIENIKDEKLIRVYKYINSILNQSKIYEEMIVETFGENSEKSLFENDTYYDETTIALHQLLLTHVPHKSPEENAPKIEKIRNYAFDTLYADILLGKILLSMGNFEKFREIVNKIVRETTGTKAPILKIWRDFYVLLNKYLDEPDNKNVVEELVSLEEHCRRNNFIKMEEEIKMYHRLISSTKTINQFTDKIKQTAFMDMYDKQSKKVVMEYLESKQ